MYAQIMLHVIFVACHLLPGAESMYSLRLFIIGDMGGIDYMPYSTYIERSTAIEMGKMANLYAPQAIIELGDNFYYNGVENVHDSRFSETFEEVYRAESLFVPWYVIAGNHDHLGDVSAQIKYSDFSTRWNFPDYFYYREFRIGNTSQTVGIVFIDTVLLCGDSDDDDDDKAQPTPRPDHDVNKHKYWKKVKDLLKHSNANYLFAAGHFPVYSAGSHGPTKCLVDDLQPMLEKYNVTGYLCGHDHNLQHLRVDKKSGGSMDYFVSGMANFINPSLSNYNKVPKNSLKFYHANFFSKGGFLYGEATPINMTFTFISSNGQNLYSTVVRPRF
ncbi:tartrate-resistant acid phosphatase type 5 [Plakobranchus ocellatus]|uniref:Tartrate-resistant acid phosphatase type 5 n=1 Tax=Plakobranchus ocellatus TaxID=259542 RepID=A0AAV4ABP3_9GAST|nr:tartrate-resistant acid phosphatase type 5 [Plakobranchus ocellatus]